MKISFLIAGTDISGGSFVIFEHALRMGSYGHDVTILTEQKLSVNKAELDWHSRAKSLNWRSIDECQHECFDLVIATWWLTVYELYRVTSHKYAYFNQSVESYFYDASEKPLRHFADSTYMLGLPIITEATWIREHILSHYSCEVFLVKNGIRKDIFNSEGNSVSKRDANKLRVLVEGPINVPFKNVPKTIQLCLESLADEVWLLTSSDVKEYPGVTKVFSRIPVEKTADVYRSCDLIVKLSYVEGMFGPPLEMFHCGGTSITYNVSGHDEYIIDGYNGLVVEKDNDVRVVECINELKLNPTKLNELKRNALATANAWNSWDESSKAFNEAILEINEKISADHFSNFKYRSQFLREWYRISEEYKQQLGDNKSGFFVYLKSYLRFNWPFIFNIGKRLKNIVYKYKVVIK